jgi:hypothetical protein
MKITVKYWIGTTQYTGTAKTYLGAMKLASKNQNAYQPRFCDENGIELHDDGNGLAYEGRLAGSTAERTYAV